MSKPTLLAQEIERYEDTMLESIMSAIDSESDLYRRLESEKMARRMERRCKDLPDEAHACVKRQIQFVRQINRKFDAKLVAWGAYEELKMVKEYFK